MLKIQQKAESKHMSALFLLTIWSSSFHSYVKDKDSIASGRTFF